MKTKLFLLNLLLLVFFKGISQNQTQTVRGIIVDKESKIPLIGATVQVINGIVMGATTDPNGTFRVLKVPVGRKT
ncbi:MAG: carboxypeptidase-like regulatory domain-containing protein, partial [Bacteroidetes bacterium]|nr:carboxypeptidase-like regulatory domain-containing protein [Bacteroidota bacterium]